MSIWLGPDRSKSEEVSAPYKAYSSSPIYRQIHCQSKCTGIERNEVSISSLAFVTIVICNLVSAMLHTTSSLSDKLTICLVKGE
jgi:hypothetical protein